MHRRRFLCVWVLLVSCLVWAETQPCPAPPPLQALAERNIFSPQQEMDLGDAIAEQFQRDYRVVEDDQLNAYLQSVGDRLLRQLPVPAGLRIRFVLVDIAVPNAFTLPGGRIYFTRKLALTVHSEDELAAVLAHELGHALTREPAADMSVRFREVLRVTQVGDRNDIFTKWHQLQENIRVKPPKSSPRQEREQLIADQVALYALAGAGYSPQAFVDFWDRFAETSGNTGGWLSDLFGTTKPEQKRLREARRNLALIPGYCLRAPAPVSEAFLQWQTAVNNYSVASVRESLPGLVWKRILHPPLQSDFTQVRFSPDGRHLLAQDDSAIYVLSRDPLSWLFSIDAPDAEAAQFTPDSQSVVFATGGLRVERWDIAGRRPAAAQEVVVQGGCAQSLLAPDGKTLACVTMTFDVTVDIGIQLLDVASGARIFEKKKFYTPNSFELLAMFLIKSLGAPPHPRVSLAFSPDAHYFVAVAYGQAAVGVDASTHTSIPVSGHIRDLMSHSFAFLGPDRLVGVNSHHPDKSEMVSFPDGRLLGTVSIGRQRIAAPAHGDYLILRPIDKYPVGVLDLKSNKLLMGSKERTLDIYDSVYAHADIDGSVSLLDLMTHQRLTAARLPASRLGFMRAGAVSSDLHWLAVSGASRGAVWDLETGNRVFHVRNFNGAWFDEHDILFADFPESDLIQPEKVERTVGLLDPVHQGDSNGGKIEEAATRQFGEFLVSTKSEKHSWPPRDSDLEVRDIRERKLVWSAHFAQEQPALWASPAEDRLVYSWPASSKAAKEGIEPASAMKAQLASSKDRESDWFLEVHELHSGKLLGQVLVITGKGSFRAVGVVAAANWLAVSDSKNRVLAYALGEAQPRSRFFGRHPALTGRGMLSLENESGQVAVYDVASGEKRQELTFPAPVASSTFCADGKKLLVMTKTQTAYLFDVASGLPQSAKE